MNNAASYFRIHVGWLIALVFLFAGAIADSSQITVHKLNADQLALMKRSIGDPDPVVPLRISRALSTDQLITAIYSDVRAHKMLALDAAGQLDDPWPVLPYLAALMGARERAVASRAADALNNSLRRFSLSRPIGSGDVILGQKKQLATQLSELVTDLRLDLDIRISALTAMNTLGSSTDKFVLELIVEEDLSLRRAALAMIDVPIKKDFLSAAATMATDDPDLRLRGQAAGLLCENALAHKAVAPSKDLSSLISGVLSNLDTPAEGVAPILICLNHFSHDARADLLDLAQKHPDPAVSELWKTLQE